MVVDLKTRAIGCLTCSVPGAAFLRVMHLVSGDYILIGPDHFEDIRTSRTRDNAGRKLNGLVEDEFLEAVAHRPHQLEALGRVFAQAPAHDLLEVVVQQRL